MTQPYGGAPPPPEGFRAGSAPQPAGAPGGPYGQPVPQPPQPPPPGVRPGDTGAPAKPAPGTDRPEDEEFRRVKHTRTGQLWAVLALGILVLIALVVFIAQNSNDVPIHFLGFAGHFPLALALLIAAAAGAVVALILGTLRIIQLRRALKRSAGRKRADAARG